MLSKSVFLLRQSIPVAIKGMTSQTIPTWSGVRRSFRTRSHFLDAETTIDAAVPEDKPEQKEEEVFATEEMNSEDIPEEPLPDAFDVYEDESESAKTMAQAVRDSDNAFRRATSKELLGNKQEVVAENVSKFNFEDEYFRVTEELNKRFIEDDVNDTLKDGPSRDFPSASILTEDEAKKYFDRILALDSNTIVTEQEKQQTNLVREEEQEEQEELKRHTWFNFMPAKEIPEGMFKTYTADQIYSSLEFDLLSRNANEVYKYEKDDMLLNETILQHAKMPEPVQAPSIPNYPEFEKYAKMVTFAVNRNGDYSQEEKQKIVDILAKLGSLDSELDESPKTEFKQKKYL